MDRIEAVKSVLTSTLHLGKRGASLHSGSALLGALPELDSLALTRLLLQLEEQFDIHIENDEISGDVFATLGTLVKFVDDKLAAQK